MPGVLVQCDGGWLLLDTGFNTALITDPALHARFHGDPAMRPVIPGPGEPLDEALDGAGIDIADIHAVAVSHLHWDHAGGLRHFAGRVPVHAQRAEYDYASQPGPVPEEHGMFRIDYDDPRIDWRFAAGDVELAPGVTAVLTAGPHARSPELRRRPGGRRRLRVRVRRRLHRRRLRPRDARRPDRRHPSSTARPRSGGSSGSRPSAATSSSPATTRLPGPPSPPPWPGSPARINPESGLKSGSRGCQ